MKKYTNNIQKLYESEESIDSMLKREVQDLYRHEVKSPAFMPGGLKTGEPGALGVLQNMKRLVDKYTKPGAHGELVLKTKREIEDYL
jgi:hypothetical protein